MNIQQGYGKWSKSAWIYGQSCLNNGKFKLLVVAIAAVHDQNWKPMELPMIDFTVS